MPETTEVVPVEPKPVIAFDISRTDAMASLRQAEAVVQYMAQKCTGPRFISMIQGRQYPKVEWWTTVGASLGLFPQETSSVRTCADPLTYEGIVEVRHGDQVISRASAICSASERTWAKRDEYAIKSMATTRATGKAYRLAFSFLAVMAGLEPTPAEEMPHEPPQKPRDRQAIINEIAVLVEQKELTADARAILKDQIRKAKTVADLRAIKAQLGADDLVIPDDVYMGQIETEQTGDIKHGPDDSAA